MAETLDKAHDMALVSNQHISTLRSRNLSYYVLENFGPCGLCRMYDGILGDASLTPPPFHLGGRDLTQDFFFQSDGWYSSDVNLIMFENLRIIGVDLRIAGKHTAHMAMRARSIPELRLLEIARFNLLMKHAQRISSRFDRTRQPFIDRFTHTGALFRLCYKPGHRHTAEISDYYLGFTEGLLESIGFRDVTGQITADSLQESGGRTIISVTWDPDHIPPSMGMPSRVDAHLTEREHQLVRYLADGCTTKELCFVTGLSYETVKFHLANARKKLNCRTREELVAKYVRNNPEQGS